MKFHKLVMALAMLQAGVAAASTVELSHTESGHHYHHHHAMADEGGYQRSSASYSIPDIKLVDMSGAEVSLPSVLGGNEPVMLNFIFTSCTAICPVMSATFRQVQEALGEEARKVRMVSISIDPENDTPEKLAEYAARFHAGPQWLMLTGRIEDSIAVQRAFGAYRGDKMNHAPVTFLRSGGPDSPWIRLDGLAGASDIVREYRSLVVH